MNKNSKNKYPLSVKHECNDNVKMDGRKQEWYPRKNWSSLMLFNCSHPDVKKLTLDNVNNKTPKWLHRMKYCDDDNIGSLPIDYNYLVNYYNTNNFKALHLVVLGMKNIGMLFMGIYGDLWLEYLKKEEFDNLFN